MVILAHEVWISDADSRKRLQKARYGRGWTIQLIRLAGDPYEGSMFHYTTKVEAVKRLKSDGYKPWK